VGTGWGTGAEWRGELGEHAKRAAGCPCADAVVVLTEWGAFASLDWPGDRGALMRRPAWLFDARAINRCSGGSARLGSRSGGWVRVIDSLAGLEGTPR